MANGKLPVAFITNNDITGGNSGSPVIDGEGQLIGLAFDGNWVRYRKLWRLITSEKPFIFWVDDLGNLWSQYWDDVSTKFQLATGVVKVKPIS